MGEESWEDIARSQADLLLRQQGTIKGLEDKLKAIKKWAEQINDRGWNYDEVSVDPVTMTDMANLDKILEAS